MLFTPQTFYSPFPGPPGWAGARRELLVFMVPGKINRGKHTDHPARCHSIRTNQCPPSPSPIFYKPDALPAAQPTESQFLYFRVYQYKISGGKPGSIDIEVSNLGKCQLPYLLIRW